MRNKSTGLVPRTLLLLFFFFSAAAVNDKITAARPLRQGQTIVSAGEVFQLGFFAPGDDAAAANNTYLGIWYRNIPYPQAVWVANRDSPVKGSNAVLKIAGDGNIVISDAQSENAVWSSNHSFKGIANPVAQLLDSGNLVIRDADSSPSLFLWQSFEHPTDTLLPGMKLGRDLRTGVDWFIRSWKSPTEPGSGSYSFKMNTAGDPEFFLSQDDTQTNYRSGPWDGVGFSGVPEMKPTQFINFTFEVTPEVVYYSFNLLQHQAVLSRLVVNSSGSLQRFTWIEDKKQWAVFWYAPKDQCDNYRECGAYGLCDTNASPVCKCLRGFRPRNPQAWSLRDGSSGCVRVTQLACRGDGFLPLKGVKLPDTSLAVLDKAMNLQQCEAACRVNCSCTAYANAYVASGGGTGCVIWTGELADIRQYADGAGQVVYVRLAASDIDNISGGSSKKLKISLAAGAGVFTLLISLALVLWKRKKVVNMCKGTRGRKGPLEKSQDYLLTKVGISSKRDISDDSKSQEFELPLFDLNAIVLATNNFSEANKLGQGGFGTVYKGMLTEGQEIAVKRLSQTSGQGIEEFKNEVRLIARLQHRNLVRLLGCCVEMEEKILIYEFMPNNSLDSFIFDTSKSSVLNWRRRFSIICGIARGLLYLHQDSRFRVIHRDLKASNILLDAKMIPKISDFGMARIFGGDQLEANTCRVVGTYGYMSPEYAMDGHFSVKSDVFSFGVLVLEIITAKKNRGFYYSNAEHNLLGYAWGLWREGKGVELIDPSIGASYSVNEVLRCLQVGLVCVQERAEDRPTMATVVLMLSSENTILPEPRHPGFCMGRNPPETSTSSSKRDDSSHTINQVTVSVIDPR